MKSYKELVAEANAVIITMSVADVAAQVGSEDAVFVDLRGDAEVTNSGTIPGAIHVQRGMLEFVIDPTSPYHNNIFGTDKAFIFYCASGGRSALAAQRAQEMGLERVAHMGGGLKAWQEAGYAVATYPQS
ncbi:MAG: rhodanese-like domain-containing protein [Caldilineaceae bacterium]